MKTLIVALLFAIVFQNKEEYVCLPCGYSCDEQAYAGSGSCSSCGMPLVKKSSIKFATISLEEMCQRLKANPNVVVLDVRSAGEFKGTSQDEPTFGHFNKAINIDVEELDKRVGEFSKYKNHEIIVYCSHSHRSPRASYFLGTKGFTNIKNMAGGVSTFTTTSSASCLKREFIFHLK